MINSKIKNPLYEPSYLNTSFHGGDGSFQDYIQHMQNVIPLGRIDLTPQNQQEIILANSPFEYRPNELESGVKKGILLIHGLYDSCFTLRDIASQLVAKNFLVRSILLPGHGTVPGDLLNVQYSEWIKATQFAIDKLRQEVDEVYLLGYSLGGTLAIQQALANPQQIKALILLAPALKPRRTLIDLLISFHEYISFFVRTDKWYQRVKQTSYVRYESFVLNAAIQACELMKTTLRQTKKKLLNIPVFMVLTGDDESTNSEIALKFFLKQKNKNNSVLIYSNDDEGYKNPKIIVHPSAYPTERILNLSHTGLPIAPSNPHYGINSGFKNFQHYDYDLSKHPGEIYLGAITKQNLRNHVIQRLSFNPDFAGMMKMMLSFLDNIAA